MFEQVFEKTQQGIADEIELWNTKIDETLRQSITETEKFNNTVRDATTRMLTEQTNWAFTWMRHGADLMARNVKMYRDTVEKTKAEH